jgi:hypothetical protein
VAEERLAKRAKTSGSLSSVRGYPSLAERLVTYIQCGLGPTGCGIVRAAAERPWLRLVGAIDIAPDKVGRELAEVVGLAEPTGVFVGDSLRDLPPADLVLHSTASHLWQIGPLLRQFIEHGLNCLSTAEELTWPWLSSPDLAEELDALARERGVRVLGAGINPGFVLDLLPLLLTVPCQKVEAIRARRIVDTAKRRPQLQTKTGIGLTDREYRLRAAKGAIGHVGLRESIALLANGLGWSPDEVRETIEPVIADEPTETHHFMVRRGQVLGSRQVAVGVVGGTERIRLELAMYAHARDTHDEVQLIGSPAFTVRIDGGIPGDEATPAVVVNLVPSFLAAAPGLLTAKDILVPHWRAPRTS